MRLAAMAPLCVLLSLSGCSSDSPTSPDKGPAALSVTASLQIDSPARGAMLDSGTYDPSPVDVSGSACDEHSPITALEIGGESIPLQRTDSCEEFSVQIQSPWGLSHVPGTVTNASGFTNELAHSFLRSPRYFASPFAPRGAPPVIEPVEGAFQLRLGPSAIDDHDRTDIDDVATLIERVFQAVDLDAVIPSTLAPHPGTTVCGCVWPINDITVENTGMRVLRNGNISYSPMQVVSILTGPGAIYVDLSMQNLNVPLKVTGYFSTCVTSCATRTWTVVDVYGSIRATGIDASAELAVGGIDANGRPVITLCPDCLQIEYTDLIVDVDFGALDFLVGDVINEATNLILSWFDGSIENLLSGTLAGIASSELPDLIASTELPEQLELPPVFGTGLVLESRLDQIAVDALGISLGLGVSMRPAVAPAVVTTGSIHRGGARADFAGTSFDFGIAPKDDLLNQFLWAVWASGALELDPDETGTLDLQLPAGFSVSASMSLPPVVMPGTDPWDIGIGIGDVLLEIHGEESVLATFLVAGTIGANVGYDSATRRLTLDYEQDPDIAVQVVSVADGVDVPALVAEYREIWRSLATQLLDQAISALPVPEFAVGTLGVSGIPAGLTWHLIDGEVLREDPYHTLTGRIGAE